MLNEFSQITGLCAIFATTNDQNSHQCPTITLDSLPKEIADPNDSNRILYLRGIVNFKPDFPDDVTKGGHYTALCFRGASWYSYDDRCPTFGSRRPEGVWVKANLKCSPSLLLYY